jgi:hypothetical protein
MGFGHEGFWPFRPDFTQAAALKYICRAMPHTGIECDPEFRSCRECAAFGERN